MTGTILDIWRSLTDPDRLIALLSHAASGWFGYALISGIVFAETGLLIGLFLPGDSLLFTVGVVAGAGELDIVRICGILVIVSILGDQCGYLLGRRTGPAIFSRPDSRWFKQEYVTRTQRFYERHGGKTLIYAKFVPVVRAFAPYMAGVGRMNYLRFLSFNVWGGLGWVLSMILAGYTLGNFPPIRHNFEKVVLGIVFLSILPIVIQFLQSRRESQRAAEASRVTGAS